MKRHKAAAAGLSARGASRDRLISDRWRTALRASGLVCLVGAMVVVRLLMHRSGMTGGDLFSVYGLVAPAAYLIPGVVLLLRRRWHVVGWLLCLFAVGMAFGFSTDWERLRFGSPWMIWLLDMVEGSSFWLPMVALLVVFPDGLAAQTPRQRRWGRAVLVAAAAAAITELFVTPVGQSGVVLVRSPLGVAFVPRFVKEGGTISIELAALAVALAGLVLRYRSSHAVARRQYRWVLSAIVFLVVALLIGLTGSTIGGDDGPWWYPIIVAYLGVPAAFMVAILRYRLYEVDRLVSRTVTYSMVVALLGVVYALAIGVTTQVLPGASDLGVAASTLTVAAAFTPLRRRVQRGVDRRFNRNRFDAEAEVERFARRLRDETYPRAVESELTSVVHRTLQPNAVGLWLRQN